MTDLQTAQENLQHAQAIVDNLKAQLDPFKDLKKAYSEGAIIEYWNTRTEEYLDGGSGMTWSTTSKYRIKDNISISSWNAHKDLIKQYWDGAEIEYKLKASWKYCGVTPNWYASSKYRIKQDKWKLPEYKDGSRWIVTAMSKTGGFTGEEYTQAGRRRATKELVERCAEASKTRDLLEAYRDNLEPKWKDKFGKGTICTEYFIRQYEDSSYSVSYDTGYRALGTVYMSKDIAEQICKALNEGEIKL